MEAATKLRDEAIEKLRELAVYVSNDTNAPIYPSDRQLNTVPVNMVPHKRVMFEVPQDGSVNSAAELRVAVPDVSASINSAAELRVAVPDVSAPINSAAELRVVVPDVSAPINSAAELREAEPDELVHESSVVPTPTPSCKANPARKAKYAGKPIIVSKPTPVNSPNPACKVTPETRVSDRIKSKKKLDFRADCVQCTEMDSAYFHAYAAIAKHMDPATPKYSDVLLGPDAALWRFEGDEEIRRLISWSKTMLAIKHTEVPSHKKAAYYNPQCKIKVKEGVTVRRVRGTIGGDKIEYEGNVTAHTSTIVQLNCLLNSVVSTPGAKFMTVDIADFYLQTDLPDPEYMRIHRRYLSDTIIAEFQLQELFHNDHVCFKVVKGIYGLPQAGKLAQDLLIPRLRAGGFINCPLTPCLFKHSFLPISFVLTVDDFGVKYIGTEAAQHLMDTLLQYYRITHDWEGKKYLGMTIKHDLDKKNYLIVHAKLCCKGAQEVQGNQEGYAYIGTCSSYTDCIW